MFNSYIYIFGYLLPVVNNNTIKKTRILKKYRVYFVTLSFEAHGFVGFRFGIDPDRYTPQTKGYFVSRCQTREPTAPAKAVTVLRANHLLLSSIFSIRSSANACRVPSGALPFPSCSLQIGSKRAVRRSKSNLISVMSSCISKDAGGRIETRSAGFPSEGQLYFRTTVLFGCNPRV